MPYKHFVIMAPILDGHEDVHEVYEYVFARVVYTNAHPGNTTAQSNKVHSAGIEHLHAHAHAHAHVHVHVASYS